MKVFTEGVFTAILKMFSFKKIADAIKEYEKVTNTDQYKSDLKDYQDAVKELRKNMKDLCDQYPNSDYCKQFKKYSK